MILRYLLIGLGLYILYKLVVNVVIPVYQTSRQLKEKFRQMQDQMNARQEASGHSPLHSQPVNRSEPSKKTSGDYIDFEEVK
jgi:hypothetical protein